MKLSIKTQLVLLPFMAVLVVVSAYAFSIVDREYELTKIQATQMANVYATAITQQSEIEAIQPKLLCSVYLKGASVVAEDRYGHKVSFENHQGQIFGVTPDGQFYHVQNSDQEYFLINKKYLDLTRCPDVQFSVYQRLFFK